MPAGKGRYTVGAKGTHGCKGYPVVGGEGKVHGCHATEGEAQAQQAAIYASEAAARKLWAGSAFGKADAPYVEEDGLEVDDSECTPDSPNCGSEACKTCQHKG